MKKKVFFGLLAMTLVICLLLVVRYGDKFGIQMSGTKSGETKPHSEEIMETEVPEVSITPEVTKNPDSAVTLKPTATPEPIETSEPTATPESTATPEPTVTPMPTAMPEPTATPVPTKVPEVSSRKKIAIDPGHQKKGNYEKEPVGPGASELKTKVSSGTQGTTTKVPEHEFTLELSLKLKEALETEGFEVILTRETADVNISNIERAEIANEAEADIFIRIHADGAENAAAHGISVLYPSDQNPYIPELSPDSKRLAQNVLDAMCNITGAKKRGIIKRDDLSGTNWAKMPVILVEAGFMTNAEEEKNLLDEAYQALLVQGMLQGIQEYFNE